MQGYYHQLIKKTATAKGIILIMISFAVKNYKKKYCIFIINQLRSKNNIAYLIESPMLLEYHQDFVIIMKTI